MNDKFCSVCKQELRMRYPFNDPESGPAQLDCKEYHRAQGRIDHHEPEPYTLPDGEETTIVCSCDACRGKILEGEELIKAIADEEESLTNLREDDVQIQHALNKLLAGIP